MPRKDESELGNLGDLPMPPKLDESGRCECKKADDYLAELLLYYPDIGDMTFFASKVPCRFM